MSAPDLSTPEKAFTHLKSIIVEFEQERAGQRRRSDDREFRERRLEIAVTLLFAEMIRRTRPDLAQEAMKRVAEDVTDGDIQLTRDFVAELEHMAGKADRPGPPEEPRR